MKKLLFSFLLIFFSLTLSAQYKQDYLGTDFFTHTFKMADDYDGEVVSTLIKRVSSDSLRQKAILYVHGFNDYFFQKEMADRFDSAGYNFYAVDLRKYGRSMLEFQYPFTVRSLDEYFTDIDSAVMVMKREGNTELILMGHSTGGLIATAYCEHNKKTLPFAAMILNSPFLDMNQSWFKENIMIPVASFFGRWWPDKKIPQGLSQGYAESLLKQYHGEWTFNTNWKMINSPALTLGWIRAIHVAQKKIQKGLKLQIPILVMHSDKSIYGDDWTPEFNRGDAVLDVKDIEKYGKRLGPNSVVVTIPNGLHDLVLSDYNTRNQAFSEMFTFLNKVVN